uniref:Uncharacterized protein n=1 Tax=Anguilla anguilla TaxID=7936 RepID=A0A0E9R4Z5_ANGAN
MYCRMLMW